MSARLIMKMADTILSRKTANGSVNSAVKRNKLR